MIYLTFREGVYRHELCGVDTQAKAAVTCALRFAAADTDDHHRYVVYTTESGRRALTTPVVYKSPGLDEAMDEFYTVRRSAAIKLLAADAENKQ